MDYFKNSGNLIVYYFKLSFYNKHYFIKGLFRTKSNPLYPVS